VITLTSASEANTAIPFSHSLKVARSCAMRSNIPDIRLGQRSSTFSRGSTELFPNRFGQFFRKTIMARAISWPRGTPAISAGFVSAL